MHCCIFAVIPQIAYPIYPDDKNFKYKLSLSETVTLLQIYANSIFIPAGSRRQSALGFYNAAMALHVQLSNYLSIKIP